GCRDRLWIRPAHARLSVELLGALLLGVGRRLGRWRSFGSPGGGCRGGLFARGSAFGRAARRRRGRPCLGVARGLVRARSGLRGGWARGPSGAVGVRRALEWAHRGSGAVLRL